MKFQASAIAPHLGLKESQVALLSAWHPDGEVVLGAQHAPEYRKENRGGCPECGESHKLITVVEKTGTTEYVVHGRPNCRNAVGCQGLNKVYSD